VSSVTSSTFGGPPGRDPHAASIVAKMTGVDLSILSAPGGDDTEVDGAST
jgi:hypothetical protein